MIWLNGKLHRDRAPVFTADTRALLVGAGVFETILCRRGRAAFWHERLARLTAACAAFNFACPYDEAALRAAAASLIRANRLTGAHAVLRITVGEGAGGRGLTAAKTPPTSWLIQATRAPTPPRHLRLVIGDVIRAPANPSARYKTTNYLDAITARRRAVAENADEALLCNPHGRLAGAAGGNLFALSGQHLITPPLEDGALDGIIRRHILAAADIAGATPVARPLTRTTLQRARALFITNGIVGVVPATLAGRAHDKTASAATLKALRAQIRRTEKPVNLLG